MPVVHRFGPYAFFFYSQENRHLDEPAHIHVRSGDGDAVFWLEPVRLRQSWQYHPRELERIRRIIVAHQSQLVERWREHFGE